MPVARRRRHFAKRRKTLTFARYAGRRAVDNLSKFLSRQGVPMKHVPKPTTDADLIQAFLDKGGSITKGATKPMKDELGISKNQWGNKLTKVEKAAKAAPVDLTAPKRA